MIFVCFFLCRVSFTQNTKNKINEIKNINMQGLKRFIKKYLKMNAAQNINIRKCACYLL